MPRYYFHLFDGQSIIRDTKGIDLPNADEAALEAQAGCRSFAADELKAGRSFPEWAAVELCDDTGKALQIEWCRKLHPYRPEQSQ